MPALLYRSLAMSPGSPHPQALGRGRDRLSLSVMRGGMKELKFIIVDALPVPTSAVTMQC